MMKNYIICLKIPSWLPMYKFMKIIYENFILLIKQDFYATKIWSYTVAPGTPIHVHGHEK